MKQIIGYARVSTDEQEKTQSLYYQKKRLTEAGATKIFSDVESGTSSDRKEFLEMMELVKAGNIKEIIVIRWDRLTRDANMYAYIKKQFQDAEIKLHLLDQGEADLTSASGELSADLQALFAIHEVRQLRERVRKGFESRRSENKAWGKPPWGYVIVDQKYSLDTQTLSFCQLRHRPDNYQELSSLPDHSPQLLWLTRPQIAREVIDYFLEIKKPTLVLKYLHTEYGLQHNHSSLIAEMEEFPLSLRGIKQWLQNPIFAGHTTYHKVKENGGSIKPFEEWDIRRDTHPDQVLINEDELEEIRRILVNNSKRFGLIEGTFYLTGYIYCAECNSKCILKRGGGKATYSYYGCRHSSTICQSQGNVKVPLIEQAIFEKLTQRAKMISEQPLESLKSEKLIELERQYQQLEAIAQGHLAQSLQDAKQKLKQEIEEEKSQGKHIPYEMLLFPEARKLNFWYSLSEEEREMFYDQLLDRVIIGDKQVLAVILKV